ncbi:MAG: hypothetical protein SGILL_010742, partial [Bacillariaceae sp.]
PKEPPPNNDGDENDDDDSTDEYGNLEDISKEFMAFYKEAQKEYEVLNPSIFSETYAMSIAAAAIFSLAKVREAARNGIIDAPKVLSLPMRVSDALEGYEKHKDALVKVMKKADVNFLNALLESVEHNETIDGFFMWSVVKHALVHYFGDDDAKSECVHLLLENPEMKRILLCFRGSITMNDWLKDSKVMVGYIKNPLFMRPNQPAEIGVHLGFREYLYDEKRETSLKLPPVREKLAAMKNIVRNMSSNLFDNESSNDVASAFDSQTNENQESISTSTTTTQVEESTVPTTASNNQATSGTTSSCMSTSRISRILEEVDSIRTKRPDYRIYVTGHSLGGALAQLTALEIAAHWGTVESPVTYIGIGNPRTATYSYRSVVETLEREGKMRCLGVHNHLDIVPMIPTSALHLQTKNTFCQ